MLTPVGKQTMHQTIETHNEACAITTLFHIFLDQICNVLPDGFEVDLGLGCVNVANERRGIKREGRTTCHKGRGCRRAEDASGRRKHYCFCDPSNVMRKWLLVADGRNQRVSRDSSEERLQDTAEGGEGGPSKPSNDDQSQKKSRNVRARALLFAPRATG